MRQDCPSATGYASRYLQAPAGVPCPGADHRRRQTRRPLAAIGRVGNNLNQLARAANRQQWPEPLSLLERLISIERALKDLAPSNDV